MEQQEYLEREKVYKFLLEIRVLDVFVKESDLLEFIKFKINLRHCCNLESIKLLTKKEVPANEKCNAS